MKLVAEIRRRKVFRAFMIYVATAWFLLGVFDLAFETWGLPEQTLRYVWIAVLAGFPCVMTLVWLYDITDEGIVRTAPASPGEQIDLSLHLSDYIILTVFLLVLAAIGYQLTASIMGAGVELDQGPETGRALPNSIAVLPFEDISPKGDQAYLGHGIADELRLELQHLGGLRVAGRRSSNAYAQESGNNIADLLKVETILEGSVRKDGDNVRITVQLTNVADGFTIWSESFNRKLEKIFDMQEEIATSVAGALGVTLGVGGANAFHGAGTKNIEAYEAYLQARVEDWGHANEQQSMALLERAIQLDPDYAAAWSMLGLRTLALSYGVTVGELPAVVDRAHRLVLRGVELDPESAAAHSALALVQMNLSDWSASEKSHRRAIELLGDRPTLERYAIMLMRSGRMIDAEERFLSATELEPLDGSPANQIWHPTLAQGRIAETKQLIARWHDRLNATENNLDIAFNEADPEALKAAIRALPEVNDAKLTLSYLNLYKPLLAEFDSPEAVRSILRDVYMDETKEWPRKRHDIAMLAAYFGDPDFALNVKGEEVRVGAVRLHALWYPVMSEVRRLPEFKELVAELNLVEYWRTYGWADACRALGEDDFECF